MLKMVIDNKIFEIRRDLSFSEILNNDQGNIANHFNTHRFRQILEGNVSSLAWNYLLNLGNLSVSDYQTLDYFNKNSVSIKEKYVEEYNEIIDNDTIYLKTKIRKKLVLQDLLNHRKSTRKFIPRPMKFDVFSYCLMSLCNTKRHQTYGDFKVSARGYASGGGLYPVNVYVFSNKVEGIGTGWYKLQPASKTLRPISHDKNDEIATKRAIDIKEAAFGIVYVLNLGKIYPKYGELSLALAFQEIGEMAQIIDLYSVALGLGSCQSASFNKRLIQSLLKIDGVTEQALHTQIVGII